MDDDDDSAAPEEVRSDDLSIRLLRELYSQHNKPVVSKRRKIMKTGKTAIDADTAFDLLALDGINASDLEPRRQGAGDDCSARKTDLGKVDNKKKYVKKFDHVEVTTIEKGDLLSAFIGNNPINHGAKSSVYDFVDSSAPREKWRKRISI